MSVANGVGLRVPSLSYPGRAASTVDQGTAVCKWSIMAPQQWSLRKVLSSSEGCNEREEVGELRLASHPLKGEGSPLAASGLVERDGWLAPGPGRPLKGLRPSTALGSAAGSSFFLEDVLNKLIESNLPVFVTINAMIKAAQFPLRHVWVS
eukprot:CAMPEP_0171065272 /NCGR_PEP_ID=MMETSP0766_2-20121228/6747_1 /TAXON_ID=439317 /ORGANISM="Gambierdiscus australes, Strain CAWD 149" /LENGTH=150 /DNA_ID=CAMNT_0011521349 /DNA_START=123 /DNA_END=575 /DNA_ORIENTATION=-